MILLHPCYIPSIATYFPETRAFLAATVLGHFESKSCNRFQLIQVHDIHRWHDVLCLPISKHVDCKTENHIISSCIKCIEGASRRIRYPLQRRIGDKTVTNPTLEEENLCLPISRGNVSTRRDRPPWPWTTPSTWWRTRAGCSRTTGGTARANEGPPEQTGSLLRLRESRPLAALRCSRNLMNIVKSCWHVWAQRQCVGLLLTATCPKNITVLTDNIWPFILRCLHTLTCKLCM